MGLAVAGVVFLTICTFERPCLFDDLVFRDVAVRALVRIPEQEHASHVAVDAFVVMPNQVHVILDFADFPVQRSVLRVSDGLENAAGSLGVVVGRYKTAVTTRINRLRRSQGARCGTGGIMNGSSVMRQSCRQRGIILRIMRGGGRRSGMIWTAFWPGCCNIREVEGMGWGETGGR